MAFGPISRTMERVIEALKDGQTIDHAHRPRRVSRRTMVALERRGVVRWEGDEEYGEWKLTPMGREL